MIWALSCAISKLPLVSCSQAYQSSIVVKQPYLGFIQGPHAWAPIPGFRCPQCQTDVLTQKSGLIYALLCLERESEWEFPKWESSKWNLLLTSSLRRFLGLTTAFNSILDSSPRLQT